MIYKVLNNGVKMPMLGYGTFQVTDAAECKNSVLEAIRAGYRLIDTAQAYGNEEAVGAGIKAALDEGLCERSELFITTKVWFRSFETEDCRKSLDESMKKLGVEYIDMVLLHWPFGNVYAAWRVLEEYYKAGKIKAIGVSNMEADRFIDLINFNEIKPALNQIETHLYCQRLEEKEWLEKYGIAHQAYAPLGQGRANEMFSEPAVKELAEKYGKTPAQVLLRFLVQSDVAVIPKSVHTERIRENIDIFDFELTGVEMLSLQALDKAAPMIGNPEVPEKVEFAMTW
ncbi:Aldo/keto reductase [Ruminococcus flavefaciens]|uniref:Aldo/keto reductase n=1 Tax=Ruminococcus flavefaciens TaxID=1265 RepID=A0A1H6KF16_RUMFL|nr:aldo/keto reductase [Ruminococcus flavefaciens]SEH71838.1 Aldo/keto reductase [Ruminococcus flavefaciens]